jgi:hypothetical protein
MSKEAAAVERTIFIEAEPETVFGFFVDPSLMAEWFGISHLLEARPGGTFRVEVSQGNVAIGVFTEVTPYRPRCIYLGMGVRRCGACGTEAWRLPRRNRPPPAGWRNAPATHTHRASEEAQKRARRTLGSVPRPAGGATERINRMRER